MYGRVGSPLPCLHLQRFYAFLRVFGDTVLAPGGLALFSQLWASAVFFCTRVLNVTARLQRGVTWMFFLDSEDFYLQCGLGFI